MALKAYKFRLYPSEDQQQYMARIFGSARFVYNWGLDVRSGNWGMIETMRRSWGGRVTPPPITLRISPNERATAPERYAACIDAALARGFEVVPDAGAETDLVFFIAP